MTPVEIDSKQRFLTCYIDPKTGHERLGTGAHAQCYHHYASVQNVIRFGLRKKAFPAGQYNIYRAPEASGIRIFLMMAYKRAD